MKRFRGNGGWGCGITFPRPRPVPCVMELSFVRGLTTEERVLGKRGLMPPLVFGTKGLPFGTAGLLTVSSSNCRSFWISFCPIKSEIDGKDDSEDSFELGSVRSSMAERSVFFTGGVFVTSPPRSFILSPLRSCVVLPLGSWVTLPLGS